MKWMQPGLNLTWVLLAQIMDSTPPRTWSTCQCWSETNRDCWHWFSSITVTHYTRTIISSKRSNKSNWFTKVKTFSCHVCPYTWDRTNTLKSRTWRYFCFILLKAQIFSWDSKRTLSQNKTTKKSKVGYTSYRDSNLNKMQLRKAYSAYCVC